MILCEQDDPEMLAMFRLGFELEVLPAAATFLAWRDDAGVAGGWMFERYTGPGGVVHSHWAARRKGRWLSRDKLRLAAAYIFGQLQCRYAVGEVKAGKLEVRWLMEKLGFQPAAILNNYFPDDDLLIYRLDRHNCRWLPVEQEERSHGQA